MSNRYVEIAYPAINNRGKVIGLHDVGTYIRRAQKEVKELYISYYQFDEEVLKHFEKYKSVRSYKGNFYLPKILLDIDKGTNSDEHLLNKVRGFVTRLRDDFGIDKYNIRVWFSGKGYHVTIPNIFGLQPSPELPLILKECCNTYFPEADSIFDYARIIRVSNTINYKTNLYKIPLDQDEIFSMDYTEIHELAKTPRHFHFEEEPEDKQVGSHKDLVGDNTPEAIASGAKIVHSKDNGSNVIMCVQKMYNDGEVEGKRHSTMLRMISAFRRAGVPETGINTMMEAWATTMDKDEIKKMVASTYQKDYRFSCNDSMMKENCSMDCFYYKNKNYLMEVSDSKKLERQYHTFINTEASKIIDLSDYYNIPSFRIFPTEIININGDTGMGKTAVLQNWVVAFNRPTLYCTYEVSEELLFRRFIQIKNNLTKEEVENHYRQYNNSLSQSIDFIKVISSATNVNDLEKLVVELKPEILCIDTIEDMEADTKFGIDPMVAVMKNLMRIAKKYKIIVFIIHHISKSSAEDQTGKRKRLTVHAGKGNSYAEQKADKVIAVEMLGDDTRIIRPTKARDESKFVQEIRMNWSTFKTQELIPERK